MHDRLVARAAVALVLAATTAGCGTAETIPRHAARLTIDGNTHTTRPPACSQMQGYRTIDILDHDGRVEAVVLLSGERVIPQWVKIRNVGGFTGSFWQGGVGDAHVDLAQNAYTITGSAYGINNSNPNKVVTTDFKITAEC
ncbi:MAG: lipoprotein LpqH [Mycobacterium sp.]|uniref:lipoprotein LpqH n=1 Tax=Mycobacterium sp. TaxID=1785 RepID=UPI003C39E43B